MFEGILTKTARCSVVLIVAGAAVAAPLASATGSRRAVVSVHACQPGDAPLPDGASTNAKSRAGLVARGWDSACWA
jgi:hypothetical protein